MALVELVVDGNIGWIYINRPEKLNALNYELLSELVSKVKEAELDENVKVLVVSGRGKFFSAGMDLEEIASFKGYRDSYNLFYNGLFRATKALLLVSKPLIISVNGPAVGGAVELVYTGDVVIASENSYFQMVEVRWGIIPPVSATLGVKVLGPRLAYYMLTCDRIPAEKAEKLGLVDFVVKSGELESKVREVAGKILKNHFEALRETKRIISLSKSLELVEQGYLQVSNWACKSHFIEAAREFIKSKKLPKWE